MKFSIYSSLLCCMLVLSFLQSFIFAKKEVFIVYFGPHSQNLERTLDDLELERASHHQEFLGSYLGSKKIAEEAILYSYTRHINGFAAILEKKIASQIARHPDVVSVFPNKRNELHTTHSYDFLGLHNNGGKPSRPSHWRFPAMHGKEAIIANLDSGIWPFSESFRDKGFGPVPSRWNGACQGGVTCNKKLIGAKFFNKGFHAAAGGSPKNDSAIDDDGHGTHTISTAAGNFVAGVSIYGRGKGTARGGSPMARIAAYKVCWSGGRRLSCFDADILAACDAAISDGVDVLSVSLGRSPDDYFLDAVAICGFHGMMKGVTVVASAGNSGPEPKTVVNTAPWLVTVAASTIDREFTNYVVIGNNTRFKAKSLSNETLPAQMFYPLISGLDAKSAQASDTSAIVCKPGSLDSKKVKESIVVCIDAGTTSDIEKKEKGQWLANASAAGLIMTENDLRWKEFALYPHVLPTSYITNTDSQSLFTYMKSVKEPKAYITSVDTELETKPAPVLLSLSSRGPNDITPEILKPDVTAPGLNIIAAIPEAISPTGLSSDSRRIPFSTETGTSMSCAHVAGIVGLLKTHYPKWSPAAIHSAIMTTAITIDNTFQPMLDFYKLGKATYFGSGAGEVQPNQAMNPGLVYDLNVTDHLNFLCSQGYSQNLINKFYQGNYSCPKAFNLSNFNYPSVTAQYLNHTVTITRTLTSVTSLPSIYKPTVIKPKGLSIMVKPKSLLFLKVGDKASFSLTIKKTGVVVTDETYAYGQLIWSDNIHIVKSPIAVKFASEESNRKA